MEQQIIDQTLTRIRAALEAGQVEEAIAALSALHPADRAEAYTELDDDHQAEVLPRLDVESTAELLEELEDEEAVEAAAILPPERLADVLDEMEPDDAADVLGDLSPEQAATVIAQMDDEQKEDVVPLLAYEDDTAGGLMTPDVPHLRRQWTCQQAIDHLRQLHPDTETPYYLYVIDRNGKLIGIVGLRDLIIADPSTTVEAVMNRKVISVPVGTDQEEVARLFTKYGLLAVPVADAEGRFIGVIHNDDIVEVIEEEAAEDLYRLSNVADSDLQVFSPVKMSIQRRLPWLLVNLGTAFLAASVVSLFETTIAQLAVLAVFQSIVAGQGGNAGTQTLAMMVRGLAVGEIEFRDAWRAMAREAGIGIIHGAIVGMCVAIGAYLWKGIPMLGVVIGLAMVGNMIAAGIAGTLVPLTLKALKLDPALASAVMVTTVTDCVGFGLFLGLATLFLPYLK
ncbi:MAG: magnesium transporter [Chloroflexi bacterium]|nr:magnesium transporter [Chloroflexota bacterium]